MYAIRDLEASCHLRAEVGRVAGMSGLLIIGWKVAGQQAKAALHRVTVLGIDLARVSK